MAFLLPCLKTKLPKSSLLIAADVTEKNGAEYRGRAAPILNGMKESYILGQLKAFSSGKRSHPLMNYVTGGYSGSEAAAIAKYYAHLPKR